MSKLPLYLYKPKYLSAKMRYNHHVRHYREKSYLDTDNIIVSYPKCGKGWINEMLLNYFAFSHEIDPLTIDDRFHLASLMEAYGERTFSFTHDFDPHKKNVDEIRCHIESYQGRRVVFLMRDPRDIIVSWYYYKNYRISRGEDAGGLTVYDAFQEDVGGMEGVLRFLEQWTEAIVQGPETNVFRYEDFIEEPRATFSTLLQSLGYRDVDSVTVDRAVAASIFDEMRRKEERGQFRKFMRKVDLNGDPKRYKTRSGKMGSYKEELTEEQIAMIDQRFGERLERLGY